MTLIYRKVYLCMTTLFILWKLHNSNDTRKQPKVFVVFTLLFEETEVIYNLYHFRNEIKKSLSFHWLMITNLTWKYIFKNNPFVGSDDKKLINNQSCRSEINSLGKSFAYYNFSTSSFFPILNHVFCFQKD